MRGVHGDPPTERNRNSGTLFFVHPVKTFLNEPLLLQKYICTKLFCLEKYNLVKSK